MNYIEIDIDMYRAPLGRGGEECPNQNRQDWVQDSHRCLATNLILHTSRNLLSELAYLPVLAYCPRIAML